MTTEPRPLKPEILTESDLRSEAIAHMLERLAWLMDRAFLIPGTNMRVGLDAILGLLPVGGDLLCGLIQSSLVLIALRQYRVPKVVAARMAANVLIDIAVGSIPLVGDAFDAVFKANTRNLQLLTEVRQLQSRGAPVPAAPSVLYLVGITSVLLVALLMVFAVFVAVAAWIVKAIMQS